jgi:hypothetical protein
MPRAQAATKKTTRAPRRAPVRPSEEVVDLDLDAVEDEHEPSFVFRLGGHTFRCRSAEDLHWDTIEKWLVARAGGDSGQIAVNIDSFLGAVLFREDYDVFMEMKHDPKGPLTVQRSTRLLETINEKVLGLAGTVDPTPRPANSGRGSRQNGTSSRAKHAGRVTGKA